MFSHLTIHDQPANFGFASLAGVRERLDRMPLSQEHGMLPGSRGSAHEQQQSDRRPVGASHVSQLYDRIGVFPSRISLGAVLSKANENCVFRGHDVQSSTSHCLAPQAPRSEIFDFCLRIFPMSDIWTREPELLSAT